MSTLYDARMLITILEQLNSCKSTFHSFFHVTFCYFYMWSMHEPILHIVWNLLVYEIITFYAFSSLFYLTQFNGPYQIRDLVINFLSRGPNYDIDTTSLEKFRTLCTFTQWGLQKFFLVGSLKNLNILISIKKKKNLQILSMSFHILNLLHE